MPLGTLPLFPEITVRRVPAQAGKLRPAAQGEGDATPIISGSHGNRNQDQPRTIADLEGADAIAAKHLSEAVQYRRLDRNLFA
jgi:hypothetical protein